MAGMIRGLLVAALLGGPSILVLASEVPSIAAADVDRAEYNGRTPKGLSPFIVRVQVLLDRARFSPGVIDGHWGENVEKALVAFATAIGASRSGKLNEKLWSALLATSAEPALDFYEISDRDLSGPFNPQLPNELEDMAKLKELPFRDPREGLAERFHMDEDLLSALNPGADFRKAGTRIVVARLGKPADGKVRRIEVDKSAMTVRAFGDDNRLLAFYPATVGSQEKPAPSGMLKVVKLAENPTYTYDPEFAFKGVTATEPFSVSGGPNNPVGSIWIGLSEKTYGIHGTPEPSKVSKAASNGCVRLTNWDAVELARMVEVGTTVEFLD